MEVGGLFIFNLLVANFPAVGIQVIRGHMLVQSCGLQRLSRPLAGWQRCQLVAVVPSSEP